MLHQILSSSLALSALAGPIAQAQPVGVQFSQEEVVQGCAQYADAVRAIRTNFKQPVPVCLSWLGAEWKAVPIIPYSTPEQVTGACNCIKLSVAKPALEQRLAKEVKHKAAKAMKTVTTAPGTTITYIFKRIRHSLDITNSRSSEQSPNLNRPNDQNDYDPDHLSRKQTQTATTGSVTKSQSTTTTRSGGKGLLGLSRGSGGGLLGGCEVFCQGSEWSRDDVDRRLE